MTYFENDGQGYVIWAYKGGGGSLLKMATVDKTNPVKLTSEPMTLTVPEYEWEKVKEFVNEGAAVLQHDGKIFVAFSAAATGPEYCMGLMSADATDDLMDPASWTKCPYPILETSDLTGQYGPGHNSFTVDENGNDIIVYHARDERCYQDQCEWHDVDPLYDPCRNAMLAYVRYDTDGVPVFASTAAKELASAAQEAITYELKVEGDDAQLIASYPLREDATETVSSYTASVVGDAQFDNGLIFTDTTEQNLGNYADLTDRTLLDQIKASRSVTFSAWVRNDTTDNNSNAKTTVFSIGADENNYFALQTANWGCARMSFLKNGVEAEGAVKYDTAGNVRSELGDWYPISVTLRDISTTDEKKTQIRYYQNGQLACMTESACSIKDLGALTFLYLGDAPTSSADIYRDMTGGIRDFRIYLPCQKTEEINAQVLSELKDKATETLRRALNASEDNKVTTTGDLTLPTVCIPTMQIAWGSSDETVMRADGTLQQTVAQDTQLTLNATVTTSLSDTYAQVIPFTVTIAPESETVMRQWLQETLDGLEIKNAEDARGNLTLPTEGYNRFVSVTWKSGDQAVISDETVGGIAPGVVTRGVEDRQVTMTATAAVAGTELSAEHVFTVNVPKAATLAPFEKYLFAFFTGEGHSTGEQVYFAQSKDGFNWKALNGAQPVLTSTKGDRGVRDPFILRSHEGDKFYLIATDLRIDNGAGWGAAQTAGSRDLVVWESTDLVNWGEQRMCTVAAEDAGCTWAPEAFWNEETQDYLVFWASMTAEKNYHRIFKCHTRDFHTFSEPEVWIELFNRNNDPISIIDTTVICVGEGADRVYYRFSKNEAGSNATIDEGDPSSGKFIILETATSLEGEWTRIPSAFLSRTQWVEGATAFKFNGEDKWCLLLDDFGGRGYFPCVTEDIGSGQFTELNSSEYSEDIKLRHGSVLNLTEEEYNRIMLKWSDWAEEPKPVLSMEEALIADFSFDDEETGFVGGGAKASRQGNGSGATLSTDVRTGATGRSLYLAGNSNGWLSLTGADNAPLLKDMDELTISYWSKPGKEYGENGNGEWAFYAAPNATSPSWPNEKYFAIIDGAKKMEVQKWMNSGARRPTAFAEYDGGWKHVVVRVDNISTRIFINGTLKTELASEFNLSNMLGNTPIAQIGSANWGSGEHYQGYIDDFKIYQKALTKAELQELMQTELPADYTDPEPPVIAPQQIVIGAAPHKMNLYGDPVPVSAQVYPLKATDRSVSWITSDPKVAVATGSLSTPGAAMIAPIGEGTARITAIANGDPSVRQTITVTVEDQRDPVVSEIEEKYYYTGSKITPAIQVTDDGTLLTEGVDYKISVKNNTAASVDLSGRELLAESKRPTAYLTGKGNYKNVLKTRIAVPFRIIAKDIADADINVSYIDTYAEPGKANGTVKPSVSVKYGRKTLGKKDYILTWKDADGEAVEKIRTAGTYTGVIHGIGNYDGTREIEISVVPKEKQLLNTAKVTLEAKKLVATGEVLEPAVIKVTIGRAVVPASEYEVSYEDHLLPGTATVLIRAKDDSAQYAGTVRTTFTISGLPMKQVKIDPEKALPVSLPYTGEALEPAQDVKVYSAAGTELEEATDYEVTYENNVNAGTATVLFSGIGKYTGVVKKTFKIEPIRMDADGMAVQGGGIDVDYLASGATLDNIDVAYTNGATNISLVEGVDYTVRYQNKATVSKNRDGDALVKPAKRPTAVIRGKGPNFKGTSPVVLTYDIVPASLVKSGIYISVKDVFDTKKAKAYQPKVTVYDGGKVIPAKMYEVTYRKNTEIRDDAEVVIRAKDNACYYGEKETTFRICAQDLSKAKVTLERGTWYYTGAQKKPKVTSVIVGKGKTAATLIEGRDFVVEYDANVNSGTGKVTIHGIGTYGGMKSVNFVILPKWLKF